MSTFKEKDPVSVKLKGIPKLVPGTVVRSLQKQLQVKLNGGRTVTVNEQQLVKR